MTNLVSLCAEYLRTRSHELEGSTQQLTSRACRWFELWQQKRQESEGIEPAPVTGLTKAHGNLFKNWLIDTGRGKNTANIYLRAIRPVLGYGVEAGYITANPFTGVREFAITRRPVTIYEDWQFERMLDFLPRPTKEDPQRDIRWLGLLWGARTTGFRRGELLTLTWDNIRGGMVWVEPKVATDKTWPWEPKTREVRKVPLAPQFAEVLGYFKDRHYPLLCQATVESMLEAQKAGTLCERDRKCPEQNFRRTFVGIQRRAFGQQVGTWHQWRRTWITQLGDVLSDKALMELSGHTKRSTLDPYTAVRQSHFQAAFEAVSSILKKGPRGLQSAGFEGLRTMLGSPEFA